MQILDELDARGLVADVTDRAGLAALLAKGAVTFYCGYDPTASSLHVGNLVPMIVSGATPARGSQADRRSSAARPAWSATRPARATSATCSTTTTLAANVAGIRKQLARFLDFAPGPNAAQ